MSEKTFGEFTKSINREPRQSKEIPDADYSITPEIKELLGLLNSKPKEQKKTSQNVVKEGHTDG